MCWQTKESQHHGRDVRFWGATSSSFNPPIASQSFDIHGPDHRRSHRRPEAAERSVFRRSTWWSSAASYCICRMVEYLGGGTVGIPWRRSGRFFVWSTWWSSAASYCFQAHLNQLIFPLNHPCSRYSTCFFCCCCSTNDFLVKLIPRNTNSVY